MDKKRELIKYSIQSFWAIDSALFLNHLGLNEVNLIVFTGLAVMMLGVAEFLFGEKITSTKLFVFLCALILAGLIIYFYIMRVFERIWVQWNYWFQEKSKEIYEYLA